jgi:hypothetical protein
MSTWQIMDRRRGHKVARPHNSAVWRRWPRTRYGRLSAWALQPDRSGRYWVLWRGTGVRSVL